MPLFHADVPQDLHGRPRLDKYLASLPGGMSRSKLKGGVTEIFINGARAKLASRVRAGDAIDIEWEENVPAGIEPEDIPLAVIYEDDDVCVLDKASGMVTHPASGNWTGTLVNALLFRWGRSAVELSAGGSAAEALAERRPGIVHRLDKDTSGVIITARSSGAAEFLQAQFQRRSLKKEYIAIAAGIPAQLHGTIRTQIIRDPADRKRFKAVTGTSDGKYAETDYRVFATYGDYSLVRLRLRTGRTHQIRVHLRYIGCPVLGDAVYGRKDRRFPDAALMLHARCLEIRIPCGKKMRFVAAVPERFKLALRKLKVMYGKR